jgi:virginiamycin A acetyltransferase
MKKCLIINFYLGDRRKCIPEYNEDKLCLLKKQVEYLERYKNSLDLIVFSFNKTDNHYDYVNEIERIIPDKIGEARTEIVTRENYGMSYGAWSDSFSRHRDKFDYFIFNEDDYFFVQNNWDTYLVDKFNYYGDCGYLCGIVRKPDGSNYYKEHAGHSVGISSNNVLSNVYEKFGCLPHSKSNDYLSNENEGQIMQSNSIIELGYKLYDIRDDYRVQFAVSHSPGVDIDRFFWWNERDLIVPAIIVWDLPHVYWEINMDEYLTYRDQYMKRTGMNSKNIDRTIFAENPYLFDSGTGTYFDRSISIISWSDQYRVKSGKYNSIGRDCYFFLHANHRTDWITTSSQLLGPVDSDIDGLHMKMGHPSCKGDIIIENDVWIGAKSTIMSGVKISNGAVVGGGSVVTKDVPPYAIVAGNPAKIVKMRFTDQQIEDLLEIAWWDWDESKIKENAMLMWSKDINYFIKKYKK